MSEADDKTLILETERRRQAAVVGVDLAVLHDLFSEDLVHVHSTGLVHSKTELLHHIERKRGFIGIERGYLNIQLEGNTAVMTGPIMNRMRSKDGVSEIVLRGFVTQVLRRYPDAWRFTNFQFTAVKES